MLRLDSLGVLGVHPIQRTAEVLFAAVELLEQAHPFGCQSLGLCRGRVDASVDGGLYPGDEREPGRFDLGDGRLAQGCALLG